MYMGADYSIVAMALSHQFGPGVIDFSFSFVYSVYVSYSRKTLLFYLHVFCWMSQYYVQIILCISISPFSCPFSDFCECAHVRKLTEPLSTILCFIYFLCVCLCMLCIRCVIIHNPALLI